MFTPKIQAITSVESLQKLGLPLAVAALVSKVPVVPEGFDALVYCDGACSGNGVATVSPGGWGALVVTAQEKYALSNASAHTTNNKMELSAAIESLESLPKGSKVVLRTDSQYVIKGCTEWRKGWERNGMRNSKKEPVANADLWQELWARVDTRSVKFEWVRGHNGDAGNEIADALATRATK